MRPCFWSDYSWELALSVTLVWKLHMIAPYAFSLASQNTWISNGFFEYIPIHRGICIFSVFCIPPKYRLSIAFVSLVQFCHPNSVFGPMLPSLWAFRAILITVTPYKVNQIFCLLGYSLVVWSERIRNPFQFLICCLFWMLIHLTVDSKEYLTFFRRLTYSWLADCSWNITKFTVPIQHGS